MEYIVKARFNSNTKDSRGQVPGDYTKTFGPFSIKTQAEACLAQLAGQAACQGGTIEEGEEN